MSATPAPPAERDVLHRVNGVEYRPRRMSAPEGDMSRRTFTRVLLATVVLGAVLRGLFPTADPPWRSPVGVVWHDEGAWTHNARNKALWGEWRTDEWNPMYVAPVFTGLEYGSFATLGVGLWQARVVSMLAGVVSVWLMGLAVARLGSRTAGAMAAGLMATNYVWIHYSRAALMEATMVAFMVASFYAAVRAEQRPAWGAAAGAFAWLAYFTKASAASFVAALGLVAALALAEALWRQRSLPGAVQEPTARCGAWILGGLAGGGLLAAAAFVLPNWAEYRFYNWQMSVTRKPTYSVRALIDRLSWFPILHDVFTRMWFSVLAGTVALSGALARWRAARLGDRLLAAWLVLGSLQLVLHDVGNERRFVYLVPAFIGLAALALGRDGRLLPERVRDVSGRGRLLALPVVLASTYLVAGGIVRLPFLYEIRPSVRWSALAAVLATAAIFAWWRPVMRVLSAPAVPARVAALVVAAVMLGDVAQYTQFAAGITYKNVEAMRLVALRLPPGTLVHGKLANGLALESRIRPVFVGNRFGNYEDRFDREDARYVLTYVSPWVGYEGPVIREVLDAYPGKRLLWTVAVAESAGGADLAALFEKAGPVVRPPAPTIRAHD